MEGGHVFIGGYLWGIENAAHSRRSSRGARLAIWRQQTVRGEGGPGLRETVRHGGGLPALFQRVRTEPALRRVWQRHSDLRVPDVARRAGNDLRRWGADRSEEHTSE